MTKRGLVRFVIALTLLPTAPLGAVDFGLSLSGGGGAWAGEWERSVESFSEDFGQSVTILPFPATSLFLDAAFRTMDPVHFSIALGVGTWGGRLLSSGGVSPDRISSVMCIGLELVPAIGLRFHRGETEFGANFKVGLGLLISPLWTIDAWPSVTTRAAYQPALADLGFLYTGVSVLYGFPIGDFTIGIFLSGDIGLATFDASSGAAEPLLLMRTGVGIRLSFNLAQQGIVN